MRGRGTTAARVLLCLCAGTLLGCDDLFTTHFVQVPLSGMPRCEPGRMLNRPVMVELVSGDHSIRRYFTGAGTRVAVDVPAEEREWAARFGLCRNETEAGTPSYQCGDVDWYEERTVSLDPTRPGATLAVPTPPSSDCWE